MRALRIIAVVLALSLMIGEAWRSWGADRPVVFVADDFLMGVFLIAGAFVISKESIWRRAFFVASWAFAAGQLYSSFFSKMVEPENTNAGNWDFGILTVLVGVAFVTSLAGTAAAIAIPSASKG